jgi:gliding motility-associated-like protein
LPVGRATVITPTGIDIEYSLNGAPFQSSPDFPGLIAGSYTMVARFKNFNCPSSAANFVINQLNPLDCDETIYFPSAFSPNGDTRNDEFGALGNLSIITNFELKVFNRYGELVFSSKDPYKKWDGTFKGKKSGNNVFAWHATYTTSRGLTDFQKGTVMIIR